MPKLSKARLTSRKNAEQYLCSSKVWLIMSVMRWHCCIGERVSIPADLYTCISF
jgi:hypothetical protein